MLVQEAGEDGSEFISTRVFALCSVSHGKARRGFEQGRKIPRLDLKVITLVSNVEWAGEWQCWKLIRLEGH